MSCIRAGALSVVFALAILGIPGSSLAQVSVPRLNVNADAVGPGFQIVLSASYAEPNNDVRLMIDVALGGGQWMTWFDGVVGTADAEGLFTLQYAAADVGVFRHRIEVAGRLSNRIYVMVGDCPPPPEGHCPPLSRIALSLANHYNRTTHPFVFTLTQALPNSLVWRRQDVHLASGWQEGQWTPISNTGCDGRLMLFQNPPPNGAVLRDVFWVAGEYSNPVIHEVTVSCAP